jgi:hypothetical protein
MRNVWIAIPAYTGTIHLAPMRSVVSDMLALSDRGDRVTIFDEAGNAIISDCRAQIVAQFLAGDGTDLVFVDHDVTWPAGALLELVDAPVDFVAGVYRQRKDPENYCVQYLDRPDLWADPETGLLEVAGVPAGFMRCSRAMLEAMVKAYPDTIYHTENAPNNEAWDLFGSYRIGRLKFGEDFSFCRRWRDIGGKVWVAADLRLGHVGNKTFIGSLGDWLKARA